MYTDMEYSYLIQEYKAKQLEKSKKLRKIWGTSLILVVLIVVILASIFPIRFDGEGVSFLIPMYGGMAFLVTLVGYILSISYISEKPFFEFLYKKIYQKINETEGLFLEYEAYPKLEKEFLQKGGLFTRYATLHTKRKIEGYSKEQHAFTILDVTMTTSSGKSQQTHFDGCYFIVEKPIYTTLQVRTNGSPKWKEKKLKKREEYTSLRVY